MDDQEQTTIIRAVHHIAIDASNIAKLSAVNDLWEVYRPLCEQYAHHFCLQRHADGFCKPFIATPLSARWQRVAIQQAAGIARSWISNRQNHYNDYLSRKTWYDAQPEAYQQKRKAPEWTEPHLPTLRNVCIQANVNVIQTLTDDDSALAIEEAHKGHFDYWLKFSTLVKGKPIYLPVKLAKYHREALQHRTINQSVQINRDPKGKWWLTFSFTESSDPPVRQDGKPVVALDIGITNFITTSTGKQYGTFKGNLAAAHQRDRNKRQNKAKLRACLEKKGVEKLPSTSSATGQRLTRRVKQDINQAVNQFFADHPDHHVVMEKLTVGAMRFHARRMNAYLYASNLGHIPKQVAWAAALRQVTVTTVQSAYSSQECSHCHYTHRDNRPNQQTFCCRVCGFTAHADVNASRNLLNRLDDRALAACSSLDVIKVLLDQRHRVWRQNTGYP